MNDEPRRILRGLCNDAAMIAHTMLVRGYTDEEIAIMCRVYAEHRMKASRRIAAVPGPEWGWKDGRWVALDHGTEIEPRGTHMHVNDMKSPKYLTAESIKDRPRTLTIDRLKKEEMSDGKEKWVVYFLEIKEGWVVGPLVITMLGELFGEETDDWEHQKVTLVAERVQMADKFVLGIRPRRPSRKLEEPRRTARPVTQHEAEMTEDLWEAGRE
jgi:hypothetical protein